MAWEFRVMDGITVPTYVKGHPMEALWNIPGFSLAVVVALLLDCVLRSL
jgi:hypothetical protein